MPNDSCPQPYIQPPTCTDTIADFYGTTYVVIWIIYLALGIIEFIGGTIQCCRFIYYFGFKPKELQQLIAYMAVFNSIMIFLRVPNLFAYKDTLHPLVESLTSGFQTTACCTSLIAVGFSWFRVILWGEYRPKLIKFVRSLQRLSLLLAWVILPWMNVVYILGDKWQAQIVRFSVFSLIETAWLSVAFYFGLLIVKALKHPVIGHNSNNNNNDNDNSNNNNNNDNNNNNNNNDNDNSLTTLKRQTSSLLQQESNVIELKVVVPSSSSSPPPPSFSSSSSSSSPATNEPHQNKNHTSHNRHRDSGDSGLGSIIDADIFSNSHVNSFSLNSNLTTSVSTATTSSTISTATTTTKSSFSSTTSASTLLSSSSSSSPTTAKAKNSTTTTTSYRLTSTFIAKREALVKKILKLVIITCVLMVGVIGYQLYLSYRIYVNPPDKNYTQPPTNLGLYLDTLLALIQWFFGVWPLFSFRSMDRTAGKYSKDRFESSRVPTHVSFDETCTTESQVTTVSTSTTNNNDT